MSKIKVIFEYFRSNFMLLLFVALLTLNLTKSRSILKSVPDSVLLNWRPWDHFAFTLENRKKAQTNGVKLTSSRVCHHVPLTWQICDLLSEHFRRLIFKPHVVVAPINFTSHSTLEHYTLMRFSFVSSAHVINM